VIGMSSYCRAGAVSAALSTVAAVLLTLPLEAGTKSNRYTCLSPQLAAEQFYTDLNGNRVDTGPGILQAEGQSEVVAIMAAQSNRVVRVVVSVFNKSSKTLLFTPSTAFITLPNGHSYAPYTQADAVDALVRAEGGSGSSNAGYAPPSGTVKTDCTTQGSTTTCSSRVDDSKRAAYDAGYGLGTAISNAIATHHLHKLVEAFREYYLTSKEVSPSAELAGGLDFYVEDVNGGPFTMTLPIGSDTYTFVFGPGATKEGLPVPYKDK